MVGVLSKKPGTLQVFGTVALGAERLWLHCCPLSWYIQSYNQTADALVASNPPFNLQQFSNTQQNSSYKPAQVNHFTSKLRYLYFTWQMLQTAWPRSMLQDFLLCRNACSLSVETAELSIVATVFPVRKLSITTKTWTNATNCIATRPWEIVWVDKLKIPNSSYTFWAIFLSDHLLMLGIE